MANIRLLERLRLQGNMNRLEIKVVTTEDIVKSIIEYISKILNTRQGSTLLAEDFGIPDFTGIGVDFDMEDIPKIEEDISKFLEKTEPRLRTVTVRFQADAMSPLQMVFSLSAVLIHENITTPINLTTRINPSGIVSVSRK